MDRQVRATIGALAFLGASALPASAWSAVLGTFNVPDAAGAGFNDMTAVTPVGGNMGTTLGDQRRNAVRHALELFAGRLESAVPLTVYATFASTVLCTKNNATLAMAGYGHAFLIPGATPDAHPLTDVLYPAALADRLAGLELRPLPAPGDSKFRSSHDLVMTFNARLGSIGCLEGINWYYGLDGKPPSNGVDIAQVVLHEAGHALGFASLYDTNSGDFLAVTLNTGEIKRLPDVFSWFLYDATAGKRWTDMSAADRKSSSTSAGKLLWDGPGVTGKLTGAGCTGAGSRARMYAPSTYASGSSVSHWDSACTQPLLMKPTYQSVVSLDTTLPALADMGWGVSGSCGDGVLDPGEPCDDGAKNGGEGSCCSSVCLPRTRGIVCRPSVGLCDVSETCGGTSTTCPPDTFAAKGTSCRAATGICDVAEVCTGQSVTCPTDGFAPTGTSCTSGAKCSRGNDTCQAGACVPNASSCDDGNPCTVDRCDATSGACTSAIATDGAQCDDDNRCTTQDTCRQGVCGGQAKSCPAAGECQIAVSCQPESGMCIGVNKPDGTACSEGTCMAGTCRASMSSGSDGGGRPVATADGGKTGEDSQPGVPGRPAPTGTGGSGGEGGVPITDLEPPMQASGASNAGCGCVIGSASRSGSGAVMWIALALGFVLRRTRRR